MRKRLLHTIKKYIVLLSIGVAYFVWALLTGLTIPCFVNVLTQYRCPACGITRMLMELLQFNFVKAYTYNPFLFVHLPIILFCIGYSDFRYVKTGKRDLGRLSIIMWIEIVLLLAFGFIRNWIGI